MQWPNPNQSQRAMNREPIGFIWGISICKLPLHIVLLPLRIVLLCAGFWLAVGGMSLEAGEIILKNGTVLKGSPIPMKGINFDTMQANSGGNTEVYHFWKIEDEMRSYFVARQKVQNVIQGANARSFEEFVIPQLPMKRSITVTQVGSIFNIEPFSEFGRRTVQVNTRTGVEPIVQGINLITPEMTSITSLSHHWNFHVATSTIPPPILASIMHRVIDNANPDQRLKIARFFLRCGKYEQAQEELQVISKDFVELKQKIDEYTIDLRQLQATQVYNELTMRKQAGQHRLVNQSLDIFPRQDVSTTILRNVDDLKKEYLTAQEQGEKAKSMLSDYAMQLGDNEETAELKWMMSGLIHEMDVETIERLTPFLRSDIDASLSIREKLGLAYSAWVAGTENAVADLKQAIHLWQARSVIMEYLRTENSNERGLLLTKLRQIEGLGTKSYNAIVDHLLPFIATPEASGNQRFTIEIPNTSPPLKYRVQLPLEYYPSHDYPVVVVLRDGNRTIDDELDWWAGSVEKPGYAQRQGFITIAPEYLFPDEFEYHHSEHAHLTVVNSLIDASKRFSINRKKIFVGGHGSGGDATFDMALSHPDIFTGAMPIVGVSSRYDVQYAKNAPLTSFYVVMGQYDRDSVDRNASQLNRMMKSAQDMICAVFLARGHEDYFEEIPRLFEWMNRLEQKQTKEFEVKVMRPFDTRFYWLEAQPLSPSNVSVNANGNIIGQPLTIWSLVTPGSAFHIRCPGKNNLFKLSPEQVNFEKRLEVHYNGVVRYNDIPEFNLEAMLEEIRTNGTLYPRVWMTLRF
jgi:predicted esterase